MHKKLIMACMSVAAFAAFVVAPMASAATLTSEGKPVPVGASITATNTGVTTFTGPFNVTCDHVHLTGTVTQNNTTGRIKGEIPAGWAKFNGTGTSTDCTSGLGAVKVTVNSKLCLEQVAGTDTERITGCGANVTFTFEITGTGPCKYSTASIGDTFITNTTPGVTTVSEQEATKEEGGFFCPSSGKLDMVFDRYTTNGVGLTTS